MVSNTAEKRARPQSSSVVIDAAFLARVYDGPDPEGFARFLGTCVADPNGIVFAAAPATLGVCTLRPADYEFRRIAWGHHLAGDWRLLRWVLPIAQAKGAEAFFYPVQIGRPNAEQLGRVLTHRYGFEAYQTLYLKRFTDGHLATHSG